MAPDSGITIKDVKIKNSDGTYTTLGNLGDCTLSCDFSNHSVDAMDYFVRGIWDKNNLKERNDIMNILELYERRKRQEIDKKYQSMIDEEYDNLDVVKEYKELINTFEINMKQLAEKYNTDDKRPVCYNGCENEYCYELNDYLRDGIKHDYQEEWNKERHELSEFVEEVKAILSLSDDKDYQIEVLKNYDILDKKGKLNV